MFSVLTRFSDQLVSACIGSTDPSNDECRNRHDVAFFSIGPDCLPEACHDAIDRPIEPRGRTRRSGKKNGTGNGVLCYWHPERNVHPDTSDDTDQMDRSVRRYCSFTRAGIFWELPLGMQRTAHGSIRANKKITARYYVPSRQEERSAKSELSEASRDLALSNGKGASECKITLAGAFQLLVIKRCVILSREIPHCRSQRLHPRRIGRSTHIGIQLRPELIERVTPLRT